MTSPKQAIILELANSVWDRPKGVELLFKSETQAVNARFAFYRLRERLRKTASQEQLHRINSLLFSVEDNKVIVTRGSAGLSDFTMVDRDTGENLTGKYEFIPELVNLTDEDFAEIMQEKKDGI